MLPTDPAILEALGPLGPLALVVVGAAFLKLLALAIEQDHHRRVPVRRDGAGLRQPVRPALRSARSI
jgi:hypothetical protein